MSRFIETTTTRKQQQKSAAGLLPVGRNYPVEADDSVSCPPYSLDGGVMVVGLNPALQKRFILGPQSTLIPGNVHRAQRVEEGIGGKGQDVVVALSCLLHDENNNCSSSSTTTTAKKSTSRPPFFLAQFVSKGPEGDTLLQLIEKQVGSQLLIDYHYGYDEHELQKKNKENKSEVAHVTTSCFSTTIRTRSKLRVCTTIVASDSATELVEPAGFIDVDEIQELLNKVDDLATRPSYNDNLRASLLGFCIMGSMPPGCPIHTYADLAKLTVGPETVIVIDSVVGLVPLLNELALIGTKNAMLKVNLSELCSLVMAASKDVSNTISNREKHVWTVTRSFLYEYPDAGKALSHIAITNGKEDAFLVTLRRANTSAKTETSSAQISEERIQAIWTMPVPKLPENGIVFPIGAGDTVSAGILASWIYFKRSSSFRLKVKLCIALNSAASTYADPSLGGEAACALSFGLACASASCLQPENSVFDVEDAIHLFSTMAKPTLNECMM